MKPRWTIKRLPTSCGCSWVWFRQDRNGGIAPVGCVAHHNWTQLVRRSVEVPDAAP